MQLPAWLSTPEGPAEKMLRWAVLAGVPAVAVWWMSPSGSRSNTAVLPTDFDTFLVKQAEHPTGLAPQPQRKQSKLSKSERGKVSGPFETFLKIDAEEEAADEDPRNPLDFASFLKTAQQPSRQPGLATQNETAQQQHAVEVPEAHHVQVLVMYGTEYGFSREIAEKLCAKLKPEKRFWPVLCDMAEYPEGRDLSKEQVVLMACSTQGDGVPPTEARPFCEWLFAGKAGRLEQTAFAVCALGDKSYTHFCRCGQQLDAALEAAGASRLVPRQDVNKEDWPVVNGWMDAVAAALGAMPGLKTMGELGLLNAAPAAEGGAGAAKPKRWGKSRPYTASVVALEGLCKVSSAADKNTMRIEFDLGDSGLTYLPGDALGIYPTNDPKYVDELLEVLGADGSRPVPVPSWHYEDADAPRGDSIPLRDALLRCYDIKLPKADILQLLWESLPEEARQAAAAAASPAADAGAAAHVQVAGGAGKQGSGVEAREAARSLAALRASDSETLDAFFSARHLVDLVKAFVVAPARLEVDKLLPLLRQLQPRLYSISSSPLENPTRVQATIAEVKYSCLGADRIGVCSTHVSDRLQVGSTCPVYIHHNPDFRLPGEPSRPVLMVGPGTGLAPFRSFIVHRLLEKQQSGSACGSMVLYFGCRRRDQDYLYGPQLEAWGAAGDITLHTAFSREQGAKKVYVQDRLRESASAVWQLLDAQAGHFYVCGDAANMAGAVEEALLSIIGTHLGPAGDARAYLDKMAVEGRYQRDVWY